MSSWWDIFVGSLGILVCPVAVSIYSMIIIFTIVVMAIGTIADGVGWGFEGYHLWIFASPAVIWGLVSLIIFATQFQGDAWIPLQR